MPAPTRARGAKSLANLKRGGQHGAPKPTVEDKEVRRISKKLILNKTYQTNLRKLLNKGKLHPSVEVLLWYYAFNKPTETIESKQVVPVRIVNKFS